MSFDCGGWWIVGSVQQYIFFVSVFLTANEDLKIWQGKKKKSLSLSVWELPLKGEKEESTKVQHFKT